MSVHPGAGAKLPPHLLSHHRLLGMTAQKSYPHHLERTAMTRTITVYSKPKCVQCKQTMAWLDREGIAYDVVDLTQDEQALAAVKALGYQGAPVVIVGFGDARDEKHWYGFRPDLLAEFCRAEGVAA